MGDQRGGCHPGYLPHHFLLTFTQPEAVRGFLPGHQRLGYAALLKASCQAITTPGGSPRWVGGDQAGFLGVLHTWG